MIDIEEDDKKMRGNGWLRRPELDDLYKKDGRNMLREVWEMPDGRLYRRCWHVTSPHKPEYMGAIKQVPG